MLARDTVAARYGSEIHGVFMSPSHEIENTWRPGPIRPVLWVLFWSCAAIGPPVGCTLNFDQFEVAADATSRDADDTEPTDGSGETGAQDSDVAADTSRVDGRDEDTTSDAAETTSCPDGGDSCGSSCSCVQSNDKCIKGQKTCYRRGINCGSGTPCPKDYKCDGDGRCVCSDPTRCGRTCSNDTHCPSSYECDQDTSRCRPEKPGCVSDESCSPGDFCAPARGETGGCTPTGSTAAGQTCQTDADCRSGHCVSGTCRAKCLKTGDCGTNQYCGAPPGTGVLGALATVCRSNASGSSCSGSDEVRVDGAIFSSACIEDLCRIGRDCMSGDCTVRAQPKASEALPTCETEQGCFDDEFYLTSKQSNSLVEFCAVHQFCWTDANCPQPYTCRDLPWKFGTAFGWEKICARTP